MCRSTTLVVILLVSAACGQNYDCALTLEASNRIDGRALCVRYSDINDAFQLARFRVGLRSPPREITDTSLGLLGTALQETTRILADRFGLNGIEVESALPRIDTSGTSIAGFCPTFLRLPRQCRVTRYRRHDALCNNLDHPTWGAARTPFKRLLPPQYADGISSPRVGSDDFPLPPARGVSVRVHRDLSHQHEHAVNFLFVTWGQLIDHDLTLTSETKDPITGRDLECCGGSKRNPNCMPLEVSLDDPFYRNYRQTCMNMLRSHAGVRPGCRLGSRVQTNTLTSYIDANFVYGSSFRSADALRLLRRGLMKTVPMFDHLGLKPILPPKRENPDDGCIRPHPDLYCFLAGDNRVNEQLGLGVLHTMLVREHNRIASELSALNPHWDDELLYQETRHIVAALVQHITYSEFLPPLLGRANLRKYKLLLRDEGYFDGYDPEVDVSISAEFATAAFRFGHSLLPRAIERRSPTHQYIGAKRLSSVMKQPYELYKPGLYDQYLLGMVNQLAMAMDDSITEEVTNHLFQEPSLHFGKDLAAINVARAREHGVPGYSNYRKLCGLPDMGSWSDMLYHMTNNTVTSYAHMFSHPDDIDLWSAGVAEKPEDGSMVGPTFTCLIATTFRDLRFGDRFWYENGGWPGSFTPEQLQEIRKIKLSRLICDSGDSIETVQINAMELPDYESNPRVSCNGRLLPRLNLRYWRDYPDIAEASNISPQTTENKVTLIVEHTDNLNSAVEDNETKGEEKEKDKNKESENKINVTDKIEKETEGTNEKEEEDKDLIVDFHVINVDKEKEKGNEKDKYGTVDHHVISIDNRPAIINGIKKIIDDLLVNEKNETNTVPALIEEDTILNISS